MKDGVLGASLDRLNSAVDKYVYSVCKFPYSVVMCQLRFVAVLSPVIGSQGLTVTDLFSLTLSAPHTLPTLSALASDL